MDVKKTAITDQGAIRKIIHIDMDAFYASVEQRDFPELRGKPVIVGGDPDRRGVVSTCSYEARKFGIRSAMAASIAKQKCPDAIFVRPRFSVYQEISKEIREIFKQYTDLIEPLSLDEAFLDVTVNKKNMTYATDIAKEIQKKITKDTLLTASAGVSYNKFLAKIASDYRKPCGLTVVTPKNAIRFIGNLEIRRFFGIGKVTEQKMRKLGIRTGADLMKWDETALNDHFGKAGHMFYLMARGIDHRRVNPDRIRKSIGKELTLDSDTIDTGFIKNGLKDLVRLVCEHLTKKQLFGRTVTLKLKYHNFKQISRSLTLDQPTNDAVLIFSVLEKLLARTDAGTVRVRLIGVSISNLENP